MHPSQFIQELWNGTTEREVFVAMSFLDRFQDRYNNVFRPAIENIQIGAQSLKANRVDERQSGDSIITEIVQGISRAEVVLVDLSTIKSSEDGNMPFRNGNVMYELGLAHATKSPAQVLIVRDDSDSLLFDISSIPHAKIDFSDQATARRRVQSLLMERIREGDRIADIKLLQFARSITPHEHEVLRLLAMTPKKGVADVRKTVAGHSIVSNPTAGGIKGLLKAGFVEATHLVDTDHPLYSLNYRGRKLCRVLDIQLLSDIAHDESADQPHS